MKMKTMCFTYQISKTLNCGGSVHPDFRSLSKGIIPCVIVDLLCLRKGEVRICLPLQCSVFLGFFYFVIANVGVI